MTKICIHLPETPNAAGDLICTCNGSGCVKCCKEGSSTIYINRYNPLTQNEESTHNGFFVRQKDYYIKLLFTDIMWAEADRSYCYIHMADKSKIIVTFPLGDVKKLLPSTIFVQIHRSYIVNINRVSKFIGNMLFINNRSLPISQKFKGDVMSQFLILDKRK